MDREGSGNPHPIWRAQLPRRRLGVIALGAVASLATLRLGKASGGLQEDAVYREQGPAPSRGHAVPCFCPVCSGAQPSKTGLV